MLNVHALSHAYATAKAPISLFENVNFTLNPGQSLAVTGPSGSGKSSLIHLIGALMTPVSGRITLTLDGESFDVTTLDETSADSFRKMHVGMVFQKFNLIDFISVYDNIILTAQHKGNVDKTHIEYLLDTLQITDLVDKFPSQLSGGEQQRVAIARALAHKPALVLADEPTGNLDPSTAKIVSELLYALTASQHIMLIIVTHSDEVASHAHQQLRVNK